MKKLVVYFSRTGENSVNGQIEVIEKGYTEIVAEKIAKYAEADIFKIEPVKPYPYNYAECVERARSETVVNAEYLRSYFSIENYDVIFIGFPNWYRSYPRVVAKFILDRKGQWVGKTVIPFCTNEEGALGIGELELRSSVKGAIIKTGFAERGYNAPTCDERIKNWLKEVL